MYVRDNSIVFSFDNNNEFTQVLTINLNDFSAKSKAFKKPMIDVKPNDKKSNSFINGNHIFIIANNKEKLVLNIVNYNNKEILKSYSILKDEPITFKNTPIIQEGGSYNNYRELEKTKKFLRKINVNEVGVSVRKLNGIYHLTLGGYTLQSNGGTMMMGGFGGLPITSFGNVSIFFNPAQFAYNSISNTKSTRIESLFDEHFNHIEGEIQENAFDKIKKNEKEIQDNVFNSDSEKGGTIFKYKDYFIKGTYNYESKIYTLKKFTDN
ncbi:hypothetical protein C7447_101176 [Tenacibaculum adriaticum]|uniref:Uncharacterized protein n=1 Tax=Tenacibaculum adriaticum TaxID=413713 RepID=A0A5S5DWY6_9FLAO|nr:hypothetical protein [Tenacibaculum adriaticum]TYP99576.1 hypothetical protein C7447_101176 [Tenacibaculum adriaticum]